MLFLSSGNMEIDLTLGRSFLCTGMSFIADVWTKTGGCVSMPADCKKEKLALFVPPTLSLWEVTSSSRLNVITWGVIHGLAWLGHKPFTQLLARRSGVAPNCPFMSLSGCDEREGGTEAQLGDKFSNKLLTQIRQHCRLSICTETSRFV